MQNKVLNVRPFDQTPNGSGYCNLKNASGVSGQTLREVLIDILNKFPSYNLQSKRGSEVAIHIESKLGTVAASVKELTRSY